MLIYGVCISYIESISEEKVMAFLHELAETDRCYLDDFMEKKSDDPDYSVYNWLYDFEVDGYYGLSAFLREVIELKEKINIYCDDPDGVHYLGLSLDAPWMYNEKTRNMKREEYDDVLRKYVNKVTDTPLKIRYWAVSDDCDW